MRIKRRFRRRGRFGNKYRVPGIEILMTVLHTLKKRTSDAADTLKATLDHAAGVAENPHLDPHKLLFYNDTS